jgi:hypothetical protein
MDKDTENWLRLTLHTIRFAGDHPYAATGIFGAMVGSAVTYKVLTAKSTLSGNIFTPKAYRLALSNKDLRHLLNDPQAELRWETPEIAVIITSEKIESLKELPFIDSEGVIDEE